jgi:hypothetical protein
MFRIIAAAALLLLTACERSDQVPNVTNEQAGRPGDRADPDQCRCGGHPQFLRGRWKRASPMWRSISLSISIRSVPAAPRPWDMSASRTPGKSSSTARGWRSPPRRRRRQCLGFKLAAADEHMGAPLAVTLGQDTKKLVIRYKSAPSAEALQWLSPEQTAGKKQPICFSQGGGDQQSGVGFQRRIRPGIRQVGKR